MTETFTHPLIHTPDPHTRTIERMAQAGMRQYFGNRPHTWESVGNAVRIRWECCARHVLYDLDPTAESLHRTYWDGIGTTPREWQGVRSPHGRIWLGVLSAMRCVIGTSEVAA